MVVEWEDGEGQPQRQQDGKGRAKERFDGAGCACIVSVRDTIERTYDVREGGGGGKRAPVSLRCSSADAARFDRGHRRSLRCRHRETNRSRRPCPSVHGCMDVGASPLWSRACGVCVCVSIRCPIAFLFPLLTCCCRVVC